MSSRITQAVEKQEQAASPAMQLRDAIKKSEGQFALALPKHVTPDRFLRAALTALNTVPRLQECTQTSILAGLMQAAQLGLEVSDVRGQAYLIPRYDGRDKCMKATFQLGYRGMIDLAARGGITVDVDEICENDAYDYQRGTKPFLFHKPTLGDRGEPIAYYAVATFSDGRPPTFVIMGRAEMEKHRDQFASTRNKDGDIYGAWITNFDGMARKTAVRQLLNYLPATVELRQQVIEAEATEVEAPVVATYGADMTPTYIAPPEDVDPTAVIEATGSDDDGTGEVTL